MNQSIGCCLFFVFLSVASNGRGEDRAIEASVKPVFVWPDLAPGETERTTGTVLPARPQDKPTITRIENIRLPEMSVYRPTVRPNGAAVLILPGGGFARVVPDLEGTEAADWLGQLGYTSFVLNYRTTSAGEMPDSLRWQRPLQDAQRAVRWIRKHAAEYELKSDRLGLLAFSAGGQVGAMLITAKEPSYNRIDEVDDFEIRPDFAMLVYPWRIYNQRTDGLLNEIQVDSSTPDTFLVHTHDDASTSVGAAKLYIELKKAGVPAELHIYENGGHGYGTRSRANSNIGTWTDRATQWLERRF